MSRDTSYYEIIKRFFFLQKLFDRDGVVENSAIILTLNLTIRHRTFTGLCTKHMAIHRLYDTACALY